jgi:tetratricopeptide (TPR) repeat protein
MPVSSDSNQSQFHQDRSVRVFVSSTFRDMQAEREVLVKQVFPQLCKLCDERGVVFTDVDLRWGITEEQIAEGRVLPICLAEIERCRPFFIGLLGQRYGWVPESIPQELLDEQPWLAGHHERSVTELEILHGVLNNPVMSNWACFYFRDPSSTADAHVEGESQNAEKLTALKQRIRDSKLALREDYADAEALGRMVLEDLTRVINQEFPPGSQRTVLERQAAEHEAFAQSRIVRQVGERQVGCYIARREYFNRINTHAAGDGPPLVVLGESGLGKSALLANWIEQNRHSHPEQQVLVHFIGATADSADWATMLRRILAELKQRFGIELEIPDRADELPVAFANALHMAAASGRLVLVIDALNQLDDRDGALDLVWLPSAVPSQVRLVLSTAPGRALENLKKRGWPTLTIEPLTLDERRKLIRDYLRQYSKDLSENRVERIAGCRQAANPLFLRVLLEELRVFGSHERLDERIDYYMDVVTINDLYGRILQRWEEDFEGGRPGLVRDTMSLLWASRKGLSESELLDLLTTGADRLPRSRWSPLFLAAEHSLMSRGGLISFLHDYLRKAVEHRYLPNIDDQLNAHLLLASYFESQPLQTGHAPNARKRDELPWQYVAAKDWQALAKSLTDLDFVAAVADNDTFELQAYWTQLESNSSARIVETLGHIISHPSAYTDYLHPLGVLLSTTGHTEESHRLQEEQVRFAHSTRNQQQLAVAQEELAKTLHMMGEQDSALHLLQEQEQLCSEIDDRRRLALCLGRQAQIISERGRKDLAWDILRRQETIARSNRFLIALQMCLGDQAVLLRETGDLDAALKKFHEAASISRQAGHLEGLHAILLNQCLILRDMDKTDEADRLTAEVDQSCRAVGHKRGIAGCLGLKADLHERRGDFDSALKLREESRQLTRDLRERLPLSTALNNEGLTLARMGRYDASLVCLEEAEQLSRDIRHTSQLVTVLGNRASVLSEAGQQREALQVYRTQEQVIRETDDSRSLLECLDHQIKILEETNDWRVALACYRQKEQIHSKLRDARSTAICLNNQAILLDKHGEVDDARGCSEEGVAMARGLEDHSLLKRLLRNQGNILVRVGLAARKRQEFDASVEYLERALSSMTEYEELCGEARDWQEVCNSVFLQADVKVRMRHYASALELFRRCGNLAIEHKQSDIAQRAESRVKELREALGSGIPVFVGLMFSIILGIGMGLWNSWLWIINIPLVATPLFLVLNAARAAWRTRR